MAVQLIPLMMFASSLMQANNTRAEGALAELQANMDADATMKDTASAERVSRYQTRQILAAQRARTAASGVEVGSDSANHLQDITAVELEKQTLAARYGGYQEAANKRFDGKMKKKAANAQAFTTLLTGAAAYGAAGGFDAFKGTITNKTGGAPRGINMMGGAR